MILVALAIGAILIVAALRNSQGALFSALVADVPAFVIWGAALLAIGAVGFVPGLKPVSRGLLALVLVVLILNNWSAIQSGFLGAAADTSTGATDAAAGISAGNSVGGVGTTAGGISAASASNAISSLLNLGNAASGESPFSGAAGAGS